MQSVDDDAPPLVDRLARPEVGELGRELAVRDVDVRETFLPARDGGEEGQDERRPQTVSDARWTTASAIWSTDLVRRNSGESGASESSVQSMFDSVTAFFTSS